MTVVTIIMVFPPITTTNDMVPDNYQRVGHWQKILEKVKGCPPFPSLPFSLFLPLCFLYTVTLPLPCNGRPFRFEIYSSLCKSVLGCLHHNSTQFFFWRHSIWMDSSRSLRCISTYVFHNNQDFWQRFNFFGGHFKELPCKSLNAWVICFLSFPPQCQVSKTL